jgi:large subunit ribosomal protein L5
MTAIFSKYQKEVVPKLKEEFNLKNDLALPILEKIVINAGIADAITTKEVIDKVAGQLAAVSGQKPKVTKAKKAISSFKLKQGDVIGVAVTLRGKRAWHFLEKLISIVIPRMRDFRGVNQSKFDKFGNYTFGFTEQIIFPEIDYSKVDKIRGLSVTIVVKKSDIEKSKRFFELLGLPLRKN